MPTNFEQVKKEGEKDFYRFFCIDYSYKKVIKSFLSAYADKIKKAVEKDLKKTN